MPWYPFAAHKALPENDWQGVIAPRAVILHTAVSNADSLYGYFSTGTNLESHFYVNKHGTVEQYMDTRRRADANRDANNFAVSIETWDGRDPANTSWNPAQIDSLVQLVTWICDRHNIPKVQIPHAYGSGIGWHVMFGAPGPWTPVAKSCPGKPRIDQTVGVIIPRVSKQRDNSVEKRGTVVSEQELVPTKWGSVTLGIERDGLQLCYGVGYCRGLDIVHEKHWYGDGSLAAYRDDFTVPPGNPKWDQPIKGGVISVEITYRYKKRDRNDYNPKSHKATVFTREVN